jgi:hypothetical protein
MSPGPRRSDVACSGTEAPIRTPNTDAVNNNFRITTRSFALSPTPAIRSCNIKRAGPPAGSVNPKKETVSQNYAAEFPLSLSKVNEWTAEAHDQDGTPRQPLAGLLDRQHRLASADVLRRAHGTRPRPLVTNLWPEETTTDHAQTAICQTALDGAGRGRSSREIAISRECSFQRTIHQFPYGASISGAALSRDDWYRR